MQKIFEKVPPVVKNMSVSAIARQNDPCIAAIIEGLAQRVAMMVCKAQKTKERKKKGQGQTLTTSSANPPALKRWRYGSGFSPLRELGQMPQVAEESCGLLLNWRTPNQIFFQ